MAFVRTITPTFKIPIKFSIPSDNPKKDMNFEFIGKFKRFKKSQLEELGNMNNEDPDASLGELTMKFMVDWENVKDEEGKDIPFTVEELDATYENVSNVVCKDNPILH